MLIGPIEMEISILISVLAWISRNKPPPLSAILQDFQNQENRFKFRNRAYGWQKNQKKKKNTSDSKVLCFSHKLNKAVQDKDILK